MPPRTFTLDELDGKEEDAQLDPTCTPLPVSKPPTPVPSQSKPQSTSITDPDQLSDAVEPQTTPTNRNEDTKSIQSTEDTALAPPSIIIATPDAPISEPTVSPTTPVQPSTSSSSWWSYVWNSPSTSSSSVSAADNPCPPSETAGEPKSVSREPSPTRTVRAASPVPEPETTETPVPTADTTSKVSTNSIEETPIDPTQPSPAEELQDPPTNQLSPPPSTSSTWYTPWNWYKSTSEATLAVPLQEDKETDEKLAPSTPLEPSAPEPEPSEPPPPPPPPPSSPAPEILPLTSPSPSLNPIEATLSSNRSVWASFFSSRSLLIKRIAAAPEGTQPELVERDEDGMEVMDVPDDLNEETRPVPVPGPAQVQTRGRDTDANTRDIAKSPAKRPISSIPTSAPSLTQSPSSKSTHSAPPSSRSSSRGAGPVKSNANTKAQAPPLVIADSIKFTVPPSPASTSTAPSAKPPSPTPSTSSTRSAPPISSSKPEPKPSPSSKSKVKGKPGSGSTTPTSQRRTPAPPNLVLPAWGDTFHTLPRLRAPHSSADGGAGEKSAMGRAMKFVSGVLFADSEPGDGEAVKAVGAGAGVGTEREESEQEKRLRREREKLARERDMRFQSFGKELPRAFDVLHPPPPALPPSPPVSKAPSSSFWGLGKGKGKQKEQNGTGPQVEDVLRGCKRVFVIGVHGWFPGAVMRSVIGEPTGTSPKFVNMMVQALEEFQEANGVKLEKITKAPLEGEGTIEGRVQKLYANLLANQEWMDDLHAADAIFVATHSQGSVVSTHLLDRLIQDGHIHTARSESLSSFAFTSGGNPVGNILSAVESVRSVAETFPLSISLPGAAPSGSEQNQKIRKPQRVCCLALCGIHLGPLRYLSSSSLLQPYFQYFETAAARELFEFQNTESDVSKKYVAALRRVVDHGTKMVYVASLNDQVVPIYSGLFTAASHPLILRALYIDGDAYHSSDFLSNLLVLLLRILNSGISDSGLTMHLSEATAGSLNGVGHSTAYEEIATYMLAVKYLFLTNDGLDDQRPELVLEPFNAAMETNDYEIPWALRDVIADERVTHFFSQEIANLRDAFRDWHPKTTILRDLKRKLQPIQRLSSMYHIPSASKL
ncbi:hypothetical protein H0H92_001779 [Tricholoma furcatifolium]|nr:hypothetical protein H0H92_001779 [Tricholoma furcatifolium]